MKKDYFIGCTHFGHINILNYCDRPFNDIDEMNETLIENINHKVKRGNNLWILGDFGFGGSDDIKKIVRRLYTKNVFLIRGNHDKLTEKKYKECGFQWCKDYYEISREINGRMRKIVMFHYPIYSWNAKFRGSYHLHSHTHNSMPDDLSLNRMNVGVDVCNFSPVSLQEVKEFMSLKEIVDYE